MAVAGWDVVVVGGGTAGCVIAARLAGEHGARVLLLEAGGEYRWPLSVPLAGMRLKERYSWRYQTVPQAGLGGRRIAYPFGKLMGGSSSTNAMMFHRGTPACYDRWDALGCPGWDYQSVLPYFRRSEQWEGGASAVHGGEGPVAVSRPRHMAPFSRAFVEACVESGLPLADDFNAGDHGAGYFAVMQREGRRAGTAESYLRPVRSLVTVETGAHVLRVLIDGERAVGVEYVTARRERRVVRASQEVVLCAGTFNTPTLLMLSGIGPAEALDRHGIRTRVQHPHVGANLQDHVRIPVLYESGQVSPGARRHWVSAAVRYAMSRRGVLASNCCESGAVTSSRADLEIPDLQFVTHFQSHLRRGTVDLQFCVVRTASRGTVTLASADPSDAPRIDPQLFTAPEDVAAALAGLRLARRFADAPALRRFPLGRELLPGRHLLADAELEAHCRRTAETAYHPVGTCRMGTDADAVVDPTLRVRGIDGLRIADASVMPELPNANTCAVVLMIAERAATLLAGGAPGEAQALTSRALASPAGIPA